MLSPELTRLTGALRQRPGASEAAIAEFLAAVEDIRVPADYLDFMRCSNGAYGQSGEEGLWVRLDSIEDVAPITRGQRAPDGLLLIGGTRLGHGLAIDARSRQVELVTVDPSWWGNWDVLDRLGPTLEAALLELETMGPLPTPWAVRAGPRPSAGFVPTPYAVVDGMLAAAEVRPGEMVYDLGCGDGRILIAAARKFGARGLGFDLDVELIQAARAGAAAAGVRHSVLFRRADLFTIDLSPADVVTLYLLREVNAKLLPQLQQLKPGARIVSYEFDIPGHPPHRTALVEYQPGYQGRIQVWDAPI